MSHGATHIRLLTVFGAAILLSATLLFWMQPLFSKAILPILGGAPSVWNTAMVCFQLLLLAGYWYADRVASLRSAHVQALLHALVVAAAALWLWLAPTEMHNPADASRAPVAWLMQTLFFQIGPPFFLLATTSTLLQRWFAHLHPGRDVYRLYVVSNAGSMIGVLGFIMVIEPLLGLTRQAALFNLCFTALAALLMACAFAYGARGPRTAPHEDVAPVAWARKLRWLLLSAAPSSLLLSTTTHITTDIAPVPLIWMLLLALYLASFMIAFSRWRRLSLAWMLKAQLMLVLPLLADFFLNITAGDGMAIMLWYMAAFFVTATVCHRMLYESRPPEQQLTGFYLYLSLGGAVGGMFTTLAAPLLFNQLLEYQLVFALALALRPANAPLGATWRRDLLVCAGVMAALAGALWAMRPILNPFWPEATGLLLLLAILLVKFFFDQGARPLRLGGCYAAAVIAGVILSDIRGKAVEIERNFYGIITIDSTDPEVYSIRHGTTIHGMQYIDQERRRTPLTYFHPSGPLGDLMKPFRQKKSPQHIAVIGLGAGSVACHSKSGDRMTFYEINPAVIRMARDTRYFTFLSDCPPVIDIVEGDARLRLEEEQRRFDLLIIDAFTSDAVPIHLLTRQAFDLYFNRLKPGSVIMVHISNRYLRLERVLKATAEARGMVLKTWLDVDMSQDRHKQPSYWTVMGHPADVAALKLPARWNEGPKTSPGDLWTDDYSNIFRILHF